MFTRALFDGGNATSVNGRFCSACISCRFGCGWTSFVSSASPPSRTSCPLVHRLSWAIPPKEGFYPIYLVFF